MQKSLKFLQNIIFFMLVGVGIVSASCYFFLTNIDLKNQIIQNQPVIFTMIAVLLFMIFMIYAQFKTLPFAIQLIVFTFHPAIIGFLVSLALGFYKIEVLPVVILISVVLLFLSVYLGIISKVSFNNVPSVAVLNIVFLVLLFISFVLIDQTLRDLFLILSIGYSIFRSLTEVYYYSTRIKEIVKTIFPKTWEYQKEVLTASLQFLINFVFLTASVALFFTFTVYY